MKITIHKNASRGGGDFNWLKTKHSFSFGNYFDKERLGFGALRVLNDDWIAPGSGFPDHSHENMEIFTIPLSGRLRHNDSTGKESIITRGDIQIMSAGHGVVHSEFNDSYEESVELLQIWITPKTKHIAPRHEDRFFPHFEEKNVLHTIITPTGNNGTLLIHQDAYVSIGSYDTKNTFTYTTHSPSHGVFIFVIEGTLTLENAILERRDSAEIIDVKELPIKIDKNSSFLIIEVPLN